jgi:hypothetical protein
MGALERLAERKRLFCFTKRIASFFEERRFELRVPDPELAAFLVVQTVEALSDAVAEHPLPAEHGRIVEEMTILIVNYLSKPAAVQGLPLPHHLFSLSSDGRSGSDAPWAELEP